VNPSTTGPRPVVEITDPADDRVADFVGLRDHDLRRRREADGGDRAGVFVAEGDLVLSRALRAGYAVRAVLIDARRTQPLPPELPPSCPVFAAGPAVVLRITGYHLHRGILGTFDRRPVPAPAEVIAGRRRVVALENLVNPTNLGVIARSAVALGWEALLLDPTCCDPLYRRAARVAMGEVYALPYAVTGRFPAGLQVLATHGFTTVALTPAPEAPPIDRLVLSGDDPVALVLGSEGPGLTAETLAAVDLVARIPMRGAVDSLNVGAAAAIACYELTRTRRV
jgi:tRNA G18 (ribose-2'-O)-methylase SpoU